MPDLSKPFSIQVDACDTGLGAVLLQEEAETKMLHPISYYSYKLKPHQRSYATVEKELLGIVLALQKYEVYFSTHLPVTIYIPTIIRSLSCLELAYQISVSCDDPCIYKILTSSSIISKAPTTS